MNNRKVCQNFAELDLQADESIKGSNLFAEGNTIYSYGYHFPIAYKTQYYKEGKQVVLFNANGYSVTTSKHKSYVIGALGENFHIVKTQYIKQLISELETLDNKVNKETQEKVRNEIDKRFDDYRAKERRAKLDSSKQHYQFLQKLEAEEALAFSVIPYA